MTGSELRSARKELGLSQAELSAVLGVPKNTIARWERGELKIAHPRILALAITELRRSQRPNQ